ncbi:copper chaperone PCu(A)C [Corynebacterium ulcerans]|uniref:copper chaperone PCu(A)C n=1 Tax=Corynebacterium ulcerans TaxID=65058 RepID=UPI0018D84AD3|nr:copper chaperone PCu(A)C [Corynebacterium ulcerans]MBH5296723.1 copper chaperone PCu(A)C [Corynebacterium ulcerans]MBH5303280.1 copper chaperone PCu(A)C [Corynebacterium ulcerans]MDK8888032.1 copper chaperone PCu(A)C [Corynebacterium ulcerans]
MSIVSSRIKVGMCALAVTSLALTACSSSEKDSAKKVDTATSAAASAGAKASDAMSAKGVELADGYVRAMSEGKDMTAIFGQIKNHTDKEITVTGFTSSMNAKMNQLHEVVDGVMKEKDGGFVIPAGQTLTLEPGKDHMMLMGLDKPVAAGDSVDVTLQLSDGSTVAVKEVPVRTVAAGDESYAEDGSLHKETGSTGMMHKH